MPHQPKILVAPLQWGLGHATRCIPVIKELISQNCEVILAADGAASSLLEQEFPHLLLLPLPGYSITYSSKKILLPFKILLQLPKICFTIYKEHQWLKKAVKKYNINAVISDNRFGMYCNSIPSIYITHQLLIKTGNSFTERMAQIIHYSFIKKYKKCWVPDFEKAGLAGELSHPKKLPQHVQYIGGLSRFEIYTIEKKYDLLISISGPEPQRTIFEKKILNELTFYTGKTLFIRGLPENKEELLCKNLTIEIKNHLSAQELNKAFLQSEIIISRCGYTTVMDLIKLQKKAILIPTPGQSEQEYLAKYLKEENLFYTVDQKKFSLKKCIPDANEFNYAVKEFNMEVYKNVVQQFVQSL